ncbi:hypothetical protein SAMN04489844_1060 [Nocardioides exalbidus]|uniref:Uncharacterized protein n=1 Tax=Nocardioides exalbidus TaxID=402596 RepID=A0A1H4M6R1_9ACTN|nr:DUF6069 family protein [Nocardioides exalbidus]SEB78761.1 hypothetical protein SAMN04489844_1060 [Nocardioides exalbidus]
MSATTLAPSGFASRLGRLVAAGLLAALVAAVVTAAVAALLEALGADFEVDGGAIPIAGFGSITFLFSVVGVMVAAVLLRFSARPEQWFVTIAVVLTAASLVPPVLWGHGAGTVLALVVLHLVAAGVMVPALVRVLRRVSAST